MRRQHGSHTQTTISIVLPALNARALVARTLSDVLTCLRARGLHHEIIVVDDGSTDGTASVARAVPGPVRVIRLPNNQGKGAAVRVGMLAARMDWAIFLDVDHSTRIENIDHVLDAAPRADVVIASRRLDGASIVTAQSLPRRALGNLFPFLTRVAALPGIRDTQCGFKAFRRPIIRPVFEGLRTSRFAFDVEALLRAKRLGARLVEFPVVWDNPTQTTVRWRSDGPRMLADLVRTAWRLRSWGPESHRLRTAQSAHAGALLVETKPVRIVTRTHRDAVR